VSDKSSQFVLWFDEIGIEDVGLVGGKNASLGEMYRLLAPKGVRIPNGFAITAYAYRYLIERAGIQEELKRALKGLDTMDVEDLARRGHRIREMIRNSDIPLELRQAIVDAYHKLSKGYKGDDVDVAVRSSATAEDLPDASFAGQQETYLNVHGETALLEAVKNCFASLFTNRAISYRVDKGFDHFKVALSIGVQKMVRSDLATSGVMFTLDTESGFKDVVFITGIYGLGENIVQGAVNPDEYVVFKSTLKQGFKPIIKKVLGEKSMRMVYSMEGNKATRNVPVAKEEQQKFCLSDKEVLQLAEWGVIIEDHYTEVKGRWTPMDMEWAKDGETDQLFIVQARPETVQSRKPKDVIKSYQLTQKGKVLAEGKSVGDKIGQGPAHVITNVKDIARFKDGEVLITEMTDPDWEPIMKKASAIVTNRGGRTCHAAIISRELGVPCVVGTNDGTRKVRAGQKVTVSCAEGEVGKVYDGILKFKVLETKLASLPRPKTKVMLNVGNPDDAFALSFLPSDGVGLAREEFVINSSIGIHPMALVHPERIDEESRAAIEAKTQGYGDKKEFFVDKLAQGVATIAAGFYPRDVILRFSDFKSNEYANLIGGKFFEPHESNPMIGWRGASRYYKDGYKEGFALECEAIRRVRDEMGLTNVKVMIPTCRTVEEGKKVIDVMAKHGLKQGKNGLQVYVMCEIPSNALLAADFLSIFDGFSIGSNDLTQMTLGVDRDSELVADIYDERNPAVLALISMAISTARRLKKKIGICGQAPSDYPEFAKFLVEQRIDSISLNPDAFLKTLVVIADTERRLKYA